MPLIRSIYHSAPTQHKWLNHLRSNMPPPLQLGCILLHLPESNQLPLNTCQSSLLVLHLLPRHTHHSNLLLIITITVPLELPLIGQLLLGESQQKTHLPPSPSPHWNTLCRVLKPLMLQKILKISS